MAAIWGGVSANLEVLVGFASGAVGVATGAISKDVASGLSSFMIKVLFPCLALSFYRDFSAERLADWAAVPLIAAAQIGTAALLGYLSATLCRFPGEMKVGFAMVSAFGNNIAFPISLTPVVVGSWDRLQQSGYPVADAQNVARGIVALFLATWFPILFSIGKPILRKTVGIKTPRVEPPKTVMEVFPFVRSWSPFDSITTCILISIGTPPHRAPHAAPPAHAPALWIMLWCTRLTVWRVRVPVCASLCACGAGMGCWPGLKNELLDGYLDFVGRLLPKLGGVGAMCLIFVLGASLYRGRTKWVDLVKVIDAQRRLTHTLLSARHAQ